MGVDLYVLDFLLKFRGKRLGSTLWLGRQGWHVHDLDAASAVLRQHDSEVSVQQIAGETGYCEEFFKYLGSDSILSMDNSNYEGADIIHNLNTPVPASLNERFDCIFDGGTLEHVFNVPAAIESIKRMLRLGGLFLSVNGANNFLGHGLYQFSPELYWRVFEPDRGFNVELLQLYPVAGTPDGVSVLDSISAGQRQEIRHTPHSTYLMAAVRRTSDTLKNDDDVQQSDYNSAWKLAGGQVL